MSSRISVVIAAKNESAHLRATVEDLAATLPAGSEIVVVDDGSTDGTAGALAGIDGAALLTPPESLGSARARNWGAMQTSGEVIVFADAHVRVPPDWWKPMTDALANPCVGAVAPVVSSMDDGSCKGYGQRFAGPDLGIEWLPANGDGPHPAPMLPGCCLALRRDTFDATGGFDDGIVQWGSEDCELSIRLWLLGYELLLVPEVDITHLFREQHPYPVEWVWVLHNRLRLAFVHFDTARYRRVVEALRGYEGWPAALKLIRESGVERRRADLRSRRVRDDTWFFEAFKMEW